MTERRKFTNIEELMALLGQASGESPTYQRIAIYLEKNYLRVIFMTANELADEMGVSQGSVSRFFIALGYHGYNDFLRCLQSVVGHQFTAVRCDRRIDAATDNHPWRQVLEQQASNMEALIESLQGEAYEQLISLLTEPRKVVLLSARLSATLLPYAAYQLRRLGVDVETASPGTAAWQWLEQESPRDVQILVLGFPRYANILVKKCQQLKKMGFSLAVITDSQFSPLAKFAAAPVFVPLAAGGQEEIYGTPMAFLNLLVRDVEKRLPQGQQRLERIAADERQQRIYFIK